MEAHMTTHLSTRGSTLLGKLATAAAAVAVLAAVGMTPALADGGHHGGPDRDWHGREWRGHDWRGHEWRREAWHPYRPYFYGGYYYPYYAPPPGIYIAPY
jgi:hypothetical protein